MVLVQLSWIHKYSKNLNLKGEKGRLPLTVLLSFTFLPNPRPWSPQEAIECGDKKGVYRRFSLNMSPSI